MKTKIRTEKWIPIPKSGSYIQSSRKDECG